MAMEMTQTHGPNRIRVAGWGMAMALLLAPLVAMAFTREMRWTASDFAVVGLLLAMVGGAFELAARVSASGAYRAGAAVALFAAVALVWINAAVGIIGSEDNAANLIFAGVIAVAAGGAIVARAQAKGMARAMVAAAVAQAATFVVALVAGWAFLGPVTVAFCALWLAAAWLFARSAHA